MHQAISYIRFSSGSQAKGSSTQRQQDMVSMWLAEHPDYVLANHLSRKDEGRSGYSGEHLKEGAGLNSIISAIEGGLIREGDILLIEALDRLGRLEPSEMIPLFLSILKNGVNIVTLEDQQLYSHNSINQNHSLLYILVGKIQSAHDYSSRLSRRIKAAWYSKRKKAKSGEMIKKANPFWLDSYGKLKEPEATFVRKAIDAYLMGDGYRKIEIESEYKLNFKTLKRLFHSRALIGEWVTTSEYGAIKNVYEPLLTIEKFRELQFILKQREQTQAPPSKHLLSGIIVCSDCGGKFTIRVKEHKTKPILYCNCSNYLRNNSCLNNTTYDYSVLLSLFNETYSSFLSFDTSDWLEETNSSKQEAELRERLDKLNGNIVKLTKLVEETNGNIGHIVQRLNDIQNDKEKTIHELARISESKAEKEDAFDYAYSHAANLIHEPVKLNAILRNLGYRITCSGNLCWVDLSGNIIYYEILKRVNIPALYLVRYYGVCPDLAEDIEFLYNFKAINRFEKFENDSFIELIKTIKGNKAKRWINSVGKKEFPILLSDIQSIHTSEVKTDQS